ncbi:hypothetical protein PACTADRAFT_49887 [Pachysolen tannophilus NRRL Y-2460]|uniref:ethanolamine kinase n=1 Tax=Pachysolen tannophilus NRRL Y-2460 TaxID=669874 RepID=A0A1E4TTS2_PACTA|nr:hypothetical protein PACTADRAFT_49887 [Pachysolen tannophilus NRRL Y-2460]
MLSSVYCLLSCGDLHLLPVNSSKELEKSTNKISSKHDLSFASPSSSSLALGPESDLVDKSNTQKVINVNNNNILNNNSTHSMYLPNHFIKLSATPVEEDVILKKELKNMLSLIFPSWSQDDLSVIQLTGGITNMLLHCKNLKTNEAVLIRTYGQGTNLIIDRDREFVSQMLLNSFNLAPSIHARFANGLVYGFLPGRSLTPEELSHPVLYPLIAQRLGHWHNVINGDDIEEGIKKLRIFRKEHYKGEKIVKNIWEILQKWINILPEIEALYSKCLQYKHLLEIYKTSSATKKYTLNEILLKELHWLTKTIADKSPKVSCHSDLLSGNIIIPPELSEELKSGRTEMTPLDQPLELNPISFIDYEYMLPAPRAFDISNHFIEWQGFDCDQSKIPEPSKENPIMRNWAKAYLSACSTSNCTEAQVDNLIDEISTYYGMPGFYWGIWAGIQDKISLIDFDYMTFSCQRFEQYFFWKEKYIKRV